MPPPAAAPPALALSHHALRHGGGFERYAMDLVRGLHEHGVRPTFIARSFDTALPEYRWVEPIRLRDTFVPGKLRDAFFDWRIGRVRRRLGAALGPLVACNPTRWADIAVCGGTHPGYLAAMGLPTRARDRRKIALEHAHYEAARVVVAHSARMRDEIVRYHRIAASKIVLLYPPTDSARFSPVDATQRAELRAALGLSDDRAVFLLASTGHKRKGLDALAAFFGATDLAATLVLAGRPPDQPLPNVRYLGYRTDIENVYRAVDFTVLASAYEPFGLVGIESVLCGTPLLLAHGVGCAEVVAAPAAIGYDATAADGLANAVREAVARWRAGTHRLGEPLALLRYDPRIATHVERLLELANPTTLAPAPQARDASLPADATAPPKPPRVTLLLLAYQQQHTIGAALDGALAQTYPNLEIVISDDASTDATFATIQATLAGYRGPHRIVANRNPVNLGIGAHINRMVALASGELLFIAAGDDVSLPQRCERVVQAWLASGKRLDLIASALVDMDADGALHGVVHPTDLSTYRSAADWIARPPHVIGAAQAWTRRAYERFGPLPDATMGEDMLMVFRAILGGGAATLAEPLVHYRRGGVSRRQRTANPADMTRRLLKNNRHALAELPQLLTDAQRAGQFDAVRVPLTRRLERERFVRDLFDAGGTGAKLALALRRTGVPPAVRLRMLVYAAFPALLAPLFALKRLRGRGA